MSSEIPQLVLWRNWIIWVPRFSSNLRPTRKDPGNNFLTQLFTKAVHNSSRPPGLAAYYRIAADMVISSNADYVHSHLVSSVAVLILGQARIADALQAPVASNQAFTL